MAIHILRQVEQNNGFRILFNLAILVKLLVKGKKIMAISPELLEILRCPKCKSKVNLKQDASGLKCVNLDCALVYPIRDEIPVMLVEEAKVEN